AGEVDHVHQRRIARRIGKTESEGNSGPRAAGRRRGAGTDALVRPGADRTPPRSDRDWVAEPQSNDAIQADGVRSAGADLALDRDGRRRFVDEDRAGVLTRGPDPDDLERRWIVRVGGDPDGRLGHGCSATRLKRR